MTTEFGPAHKCRRCGVEMQLVQRSFGRSAFEEIATGRNHRYYCAVRNAETAAMIAALREPEYMPERPHQKPKYNPATQVAGGFDIP